MVSVFVLTRRILDAASVTGKGMLIKHVSITQIASRAYAMILLDVPLCPLVRIATPQTSAPLVGYVPPKIFVKIQPAFLAQAKASVFLAPLAL
jgi:hypothetical protein